jgi:hypothetical protein
MKKDFKKAIITLGLFLSLFLSMSITVYATEYVELAPLPGTCESRTDGNGNVKCVTDTSAGNLGNYLNNIYKLAVASAGVLAVLMIVMGGFSYISTDAISNKEEGKHQIKMALGGLLVVFASYIILNTINPQLVELKIVSDPLQSTNLTELLMMSRQAQTDFDSAVQKSLNDLNALKQDTAKLRSEAGAIQQKADSYRKMNELKRIMSAQGNSSASEEEVLRGQDIKNTYFPGKTDEQILKELEGLPNIEKEILEKTKAPDITKALEQLDTQAKDIRNLAQTTSSVEGFKIDMTQKPENFKINVADGKIDVHNPTDTQNALNALVGEYKDRATTINSLDIPQNIKDQKILELKASAEAARSAICSQIPQTVIVGGYGGAGQRTNEGYAPCKTITIN